MGKPQKQNAVKETMTGLQKLGLRVSAMINHPVAQLQRWVTIHRLDSDGDLEWDEVLGVLSETDGLEMTLNDDGSITLRWEASDDTDDVVEERDELSVISEEAVAPF